MNEQDNPVDPTPLGFSTYFVDVRRKFQHGIINLDKLVKEFPLDVQEEITDEGLTIKQGDNIVKSSYDVCSSTRRINKEFTYQPVGFTKITYPKNLETVKYSRPSEIIPTGCWCNSCYKVGPFGHKADCNSPVNSSLRLTLKGFVKCYYSLNNATVRKKLRNISSEEVKKDIVGFFETVSSLEKSIDGKEVYLTAAKEHSKNSNILFNTSVVLEEDFPTNIKYSAVQSFKNTYFWPGCVELQYYNEKHNKVSIRIYEDKMAIVSYPWNQDDPETIIDKVIERLSEIEDPNIFVYKGSVVKNANGKFRLFPVRINKRLDLDNVYSYFHPTNEATGSPIDVPGVKETHKTTKMVDDKQVITVNTYFVKDSELYKYSVVKEPKRGKMSIKDIVKCDRRDNQIYCSEVKITAQIFNSGIIQLFFSYVNKDNIAASSIKKQLEIVESGFESIKNLFVHHFKEFDDSYFEDVQPEEESAHIWNTVPGIMPVAVKKKFDVGYQIERFDKESDDWSGEYEYVIRSNRDITPHRYYIIPGAMATKRTVKEFDASTKKVGQKPPKNKLYNMVLPPVLLDDDTRGFSLESMKEGKDEYLVIEGSENEWELINPEEYRVYKKDGSNKPYESTTQVCPKNRKGIPMKPEPYSFYGKCQGGKNQYIERTGVHSRLDFKYYPCCVNIKDSKEGEVKEQMVSFLLDGMTDEDIEEANIEVDYLHGEKIDDKYSGTLVPGANDIGNNVTFWNDAEWIDGRIVYRKKRQHQDRTDIFIESNEDVENQAEQDKIISEIKQDKKGDYEDDGKKLYVVTGSDLHPKHRESRNFKGLRNIIEDEEEQKDLLINCAKKLKLISTEIDLKKADNKLQKRVLNNLEEITGKNYFHEVVTGIEPFVGNRIKNLEKHAYEVAVIPEGTLRTLLLILDSDKQYLIDTSNKVMPVDLDISDEYNRTVIDGFSTENRVFYPIDLLYKNGSPVRTDYLKNDTGRIYELKKVTEAIIRTHTPRSITVRKPLGTRLESGYIGPSRPEESLLSYVFVSRKPSSKMVFIPQTGTSRFMIWKPRSVDHTVVLQTIAKDTKTGGWWLGIKTPPGKAHIRLINTYPLMSKDIKNGNFVKLRINIMSSGEINPKKPYLDIKKVDASEMLPLEDTKVRVHTITKMVDKTVFEDSDMWKFKSIQVAYEPDESSRNPLLNIGV